MGWHRMLGPVPSWVWNLAIIGLDIIHLLHSSLNVVSLHACHQPGCVSRRLAMC